MYRIANNGEPFCIDHVSGAIIWTVVEANVIMIAACAPTLHPVYERVRKRLSHKYSGDDSFPTLSEGNMDFDGNHNERNFSNQTDRNPGKPKGFWTAVLGMSSMTSSTLTTQRTDRTRSSRGRTIGASATGDDDECEEQVSPPAAVPMRTLEDAVDWDIQEADLECGTQGGVDKAQLKLYHALQSGEQD